MAAGEQKMVDMNDQLRALGEMVRQQTEPGAETEHTLRFVKNRLRLTAYAARKSRAPRYTRVAVSTVAAAALVLAIFFLPQSNKPLTVALESQESHLVGQWVQSKNETKQLRFSDGTSVALGPETTINITETTRFGGTVVVGQGRARAQIVHTPSARWTFKAGPFQVRVTGTEFDLGWDPNSETLELALHQGSVELSGPTLDKPRKLRKGEFIRLQLAEKRQQHAEEAQLEQKQLTGASSAQSNQEDADATESSAEERSDSRQNSRITRDLSQTSSQDLWDLSQSARLSGKPTLARDALLALRTHHGTRGQTAFLLGKINADQLQNGAEAIRWFQTYLKEVPGGSLSEQAWGRLIELQAGTAAGRKSARDYLDRYPNGSYKTLAQRSLH